MAPAPDPFEPYLNRAASLFDLGDIVQAGQIWQAILKREPDHAVARAGLYKVKVHFDARATRDGLAAAPAPEERPQPVTATPRLEVDLLLEQGCALYDQGNLFEAIAVWEQVLAQDPENSLASGYLDGARRKLAAAESIPAPEAPVIQDAGLPEQNNEQLLRNGCTLFDMGQVEDALRTWERILAADPHHELALAYANGARKELGLPELTASAAALAAAAPAPVQVVPAPAPVQDSPDAQAEQLILNGVQLYDMGMVEEAVVAWQRALEVDPKAAHAAEYLQMAHRDQQKAAPAQATPPVPEPAPAPRPEPAPAELPENAILQAEQLLRSQRFEEAAQAFHRLLEAHPGEARLHHGYQQARALAATAAQAPQTARPEQGQSPLLKSAPIPTPVGPPKALTTRATPARYGLKVPGYLAALGLPQWLTTPRNLGLALGTILVLGLGASFFRDHVQEAALKQAVSSAKSDAMKPVERQLEIASLAETPEALRQEAEAALGEDPFVAYCRAQEWHRLEPVSATATQLLEKARARMATVPGAGDLAEFRKMTAAGDLEAAAAVIHGLLRQSPDDPELRSHARTVNLALAQYYATKERYGDAKDCLCRVRAMYPQERIWQAKLKLLETIQTMPRAERAGWIQMLG